MALIKHLVDLDLNKNQLLNTVVQNLASAPSSPADGQIYWSTADDTLYAYNGSAWIDLGSSGITNLSYTAGVSGGTVVSNTGSNASIPLADGTNAGLMTAAEKSNLGNQSGTNSGDNAINSNYSGLVSNVSTDLSEGTTTSTTVDVNSSDGNNATLAQASTTRAGLLSSAKWDEIVANTAKVSDINHNVTTNLSEGTATNTTVNVNSSDGSNATLASASTTRAGLLSKAKYDEIVANSLKVSNVDETLTSISIAANVITYTDENGNDTDIDLATYLDDSNLARLTSGSINGSTGLATFTRDDASTFTIDMSAFLDAITLNNTLTSTSTTEGLTAAQGKVLKDLIDGLNVGTGSNTGDEPDASLTVKGIVELATVAETNTGTDATRAVTPDGLDGWTGSGQITTVGAISSGSWGGDVIPEAKLQNQSGTNTGDEPNASTTVRGIVELATPTETVAGTDTSRAVTPSGLTSKLSGYARTYTRLVSETTTTTVITHNLGNQYVQTQLFEGADKVIAEIENTSANTITLKFNVAPTANQYRVVIQG